MFQAWNESQLEWMLVSDLIYDKNELKIVAVYPPMD
jgi:hypothetical protein